MVLDKPPASITSFLVLTKKELHRIKDILEDQNYGVQLIFTLKVNKGIHLRNYMFIFYLTLNLLANCNCSSFNINFAITCTISHLLFISTLKTDNFFFTFISLEYADSSNQGDFLFLGSLALRICSGSFFVRVCFFVLKLTKTFTIVCF